MKAYLVLCIALLASALSPTANALIILQYHHIADHTPKATSTSPTRFAEHLAYLNKEGYRVIDLKTALNAINQKKLPLAKTVLITFDDGSKSIYDTALPLLKKYDYPFTVFVNTDAVEQQLGETLSWAQINTLKKNGGAIANHSASHGHMVRRQQGENERAWLARQRNEIEQAQALIKQHTGDDYRAFAYPFGEYNNALKGLLKDMGYTAFGQHSGPAGNFDPLAIPRFPMGGRYGGPDDFQLKLKTKPYDSFNVSLVTDERTAPFDTVLATDQTRPIIAIEMSNTQQLNAVTCYLSPGDKTHKTRIDETTAHFQAQTPHPIGRSRFNCTAPAGNGHYYWHSIPMIRRHADGSWADE